MKNFLYAALIIMLLFSFQQNIQAQAVGCGTGRYENESFADTINKKSNIRFGNNVGVNGPVNLYLNFYEPKNDTASKRPLMIIGFGGSFIGGNKSDVDDLCRSYAKMGYATVAFDYRVGFFIPNEVTTTLAVVKAMHDMKAVVRFFKQDASTVDTFRIDTTRIIVGGVSAGAITAIHTAYLDSDAEIPAYLYNDTTGLGGVEGNSGNPGYSSKVAAAFSFSGAIGDTNWINTGDIPSISFHDIGDNTVPYDTREVSVSGVPTGLIASGSRDIHARCMHVGVLDTLYSYTGNGHVAYLSSNYTQTVTRVKDFMFTNVTCKQDVNSGIAKNNLKEPEINLYPNPTTGVLNIESFVATEKPYSINIYDYSGKNVFSEKNITGAKQQLLLDLSTGIYRVNIQYNDNQYSVFSRNIIFE